MKKKNGSVNDDQTTNNKKKCNYETKTNAAKLQVFNFK